MNLRSFWLLLMVSFSVALIIVGFILIKTGFLDRNRKNRNKHKKSENAAVGRLLILTGAILAIVCGLFLVINLFGFFPE